MKENHSYYQEQMQRSKCRLAEIEERGAAAMSRYDIEIAHGGNAQQAVETAKLLIGSHLRYYGERLAELGPEIRQMDLFGGLAPTADVFVAPEPVEDDHLESGYDERQGEGMDFDDDMEDYEPSPYDGTYMED